MIIVEAIVVVTSISDRQMIVSPVCNVDIGGDDDEDVWRSSKRMRTMCDSGEVKLADGYF